MGPVAHSSLGYLAWQLSSASKNKQMALLFLFIANLPDIDFLFQLFLNTEQSIHQLYTHNLLFVALVILCTLLVCRQCRKLWALLLFTGLSHLVLDLFVIDRVKPIGIKILYPFLDQNVNFGFFPYFIRGGFGEIISFHNLFVFTMECVIFTGLVWIIIKMRNILKNRNE